jgi:hypothetical protein
VLEETILEQQMHNNFQVCYKMKHISGLEEHEELRENIFKDKRNNSMLVY